jgi:transcriptional regulator with XRE-family HTH domain
MSSESPSVALVALLRNLAKERGLNTAALAQEAGLERSRVKALLAGKADMLVDELMQLSEALQIGAADLAALGAQQTPIDESASPEASPQASAAGGLKQVDHQRLDSWTVDPYGNHAEQALRLGFGLSCDIFMILDTPTVADSGIPESVRNSFPKGLPIRLDAAYHRHNDPRFLPDGLQIALSFDSLHTCLIPWKAFVQIALFPIQEDPEPESAPEPGGRGHLRLVE